MESAEYFKNSVKTHIKNDSGYNRFIGVIIARFNKAEVYDRFKPQLNYIVNLHRTLYSLRAYDISSVQHFEEDTCAEFIADFDNACANSVNYTEQDFYKLVGKMLNVLIKDYNSILEVLNKLKTKKDAEEKARVLENQKKTPNNVSINTARLNEMLRVPSRDQRDSNIRNTTSDRMPSLTSIENKGSNQVITGNKPVPKLRFYVNPANQTFDKQVYMDEIEADRTLIPKAFEKNLAWAVTQFPDKILREKIQSCIKYHRTFETFLDTEYDAILRFENLVTTYYLSLTYSLVSIPQAIADSNDKFMEVDNNLIGATDDYLKAIKELVDKFMKKVDMTTKTQLDTFKNIVDSIM